MYAVPTCGSPVGEGAMRTRTPEAVILCARQMNAGRLSLESDARPEGIQITGSGNRLEKGILRAFAANYPFGWP
jgi:hypothetical protein